MVQQQSAESVPDFIEVSGPLVAENRQLNILSIGIPAVGAVLALASIPWLGFTPTTLATLLVFFLANVVGIGVGLHRYFSHHSYRISRGGEYLLAVLGTMACQGPIDRWVADHRRHHRYADRAWDTHSPHWKGEVPIRGLPGLWHAHVGWMLDGHVSAPARYAPDVKVGTPAHWASRHYAAICGAGILLPCLVGAFVGGYAEAVRCALWAGFFRVALLHQLTWSVNSMCHSVGKRLSELDQSRDNMFLTFALLGEGLHSSHHLHPTSAVNGPLWKDWGGALLVGAEKMALVSAVKRPYGRKCGVYPATSAQESHSVE